MYLRKKLVTALKIKNVLLCIFSVLEIFVSAYYIVSEFTAYWDKPEYAWGAVDMKLSIVLLCVGIGVLLLVLASSQFIGNAVFYSSYFEGDLDGFVTCADLSRVMGKSPSAVYRHLAFYRLIYMKGFVLKQSEKGAYAELNSKTCLCECKNCGAHIEKKVYFTGECPYCHSSDLHAKVLSGEHFYSISNNAHSAAGNADFYRAGLVKLRAVLYFILVILGTSVVAILVLFTASQVSNYFDKEYQKKVLLDASNHLYSYELIKKDILDVIVFAVTLIVVLLPAVIMRWKKTLALFAAIQWSKFFATVRSPFVKESRLPQYSVGKAKLSRMRRAIRNRYLKNCTLEVHDDTLMVALAKKVVKDQCVSCGAPITGVTDENTRCSYCGNPIMGVLEKR